MAQKRRWLRIKWWRDPDHERQRVRAALPTQRKLPAISGRYHDLRHKKAIDSKTPMASNKMVARPGIEPGTQGFSVVINIGNTCPLFSSKVIVIQGFTDIGELVLIALKCIIMTSLDTKRGTLGGRWSKNQPHKDSVDYWRKRVTKRRSGTGREIGHYSVRFRQSGREAWFSLSTANVAIAANQAREIHRHIQANGLLSAIERYKVKDDFRERPPTIGEWIESVKKYRSREDCRETTFADYVRKTRT
ncbi:MAG: hypothetical protein JJU20_10645, partial [Opitutales bacterium]|nr:hypothetical protein [Opitutales bacterium]